jgi:hypothetical protein
VKWAAVLLCLLGLLNLCEARHGKSTAFDCNAWGGSCACFLASASGLCGNATAHFSNAVCNGASDDSAALADWISYAHGLGTALAVLYVPPGSSCSLGGAHGNISFVADNTVHCAGFGAQPDTTVKNAIIWQYGATYDQMWFGGQAFFTAQNTQGVVTGCGSGPTNTSPLIQQAIAGDTTVTLITAGEASNFAVGKWIQVTALANQVAGAFPPTHTFHEPAQITAINGGVLSLSAPLRFSYKTTYPDLGGTQPYQGGPATIYLMELTYDLTARFYGGTVTNTNQSNIIGRNITLTDVVWSNAASNGPNPTQSASIINIRGAYPGQEVDKENDTLVLFMNQASQTDVQSSSVNTFMIQGSTFSGKLNGSAANTTLSNSSFGSITAGPTCCGVGTATVLDRVTFQAANTNYHHTLISAYSFSAGTLTIAKANAEYTNGKSPGLWVPGHKYFVGDSDGSNTCSPANTFTVSDVVDAGSNVNIVTDLPSVSFGNTCGSGTRAPTTYGAYQTMTLTQTSSGPANLTSNPEMLPP